MPMIRPRSDLFDYYDEISEYVNTTNNPVFLTKEGYGNIVVLSIQAYEELARIDALHSGFEKDEGKKSKTD